MTTSKVFNDSTYWRAFDENRVTHSVAHYLMAVDRLLEENGYARVTDVASALKITRGAASLALTQLKERGLIKEDPNRFLLLTDRGKELAQVIEKNFILLHKFFDEILGVSEEQAHADACKMEHLLSEASSIKLHHFLQVLFSNQHLLQDLLTTLKETNTDCKGHGSCELCDQYEECLLPHFSHEAEPNQTASTEMILDK